MLRGCGHIDCVNQCGGEDTWETCPHAQAAREVQRFQFTDEEVEVAAVMHYDHHYGPGSFRNIAPRARKRLIFRMRAALATLPQRKR